MKELDELLVAAEGIKAPLGQMSDELKRIEASLLSLNFPFSFLCHKEDHSEIHWYLEWNLYEEKCPKFRIYLTGIHGLSREKTFNKALAECKLEVRMSFYRYLIPFMSAFTKAIRTEKERIKKILEGPHEFIRDTDDTD